METKPSPLIDIHEASHALQFLQYLGLKFFQQTGDLDDDYRIMIPSQEIVVSRDLATQTVQVTISISDR